MSSSLAGKNVVVLGLGLFGGGLGAALHALRRGARVVVTDRRDETALAEPLRKLRAQRTEGNVRLVLGRHDDADFEDADVVIVNPAVPPSARPLQIARTHGARITTAIAILLEEAPPCTIAAVTGTHGKSSTVRFLGTILERAGRRVHVGGNLGGSLLDRLGTFESSDLIVLELSSYQLEHLPRNVSRSVRVAGITNIGVDHIERHGSTRAYAEAKFRIAEVLEPGGTLVLPSDRTVSARGIDVVHHGRDEAIRVDEDGRFVSGGAVLGDTGQLRVLGAFQRENAALALGIGHLLGVSATDCAASVPHLAGLPHRLERLGWFTHGETRFDVVDNGVSTTPDTTVAAMRALAEDPWPDGVRYLLAGGQPKRGQSFDAMGVEAAEGNWIVAPFGAGAAAIESAVRAAGGVVASGGPWPDPVHAIEHLRNEFPSGTHVLFSPGCASFDQYPNFRARAVAFRNALTPKGLPSAGDRIDRASSPTERGKLRD